MNVMNNSSGDEEQAECPLCMEPLEVDDLNFYPCTCGYQICRFCWHRIRTDENELCPACRKAYPENPADFTPLSQEQISAFKAEKRQRDQQRKAKISENRKHLANVRVVQKNLVFVVGLPPRLADPEILKKHEYFGKYGKIHKVVINPSTTYAGGPSASAYVTYINNNDALKAIQSVNNIMIDGRLIKTSLGTTKYCSHFMKNQSCPKPDCMYLHELGDQEASFTKEEMHQGKHQEYEKRLHDTMQAQLGLTPSTGGGSSNGTALAVSNGSSGGGVGNGNVSVNGGGGGGGTGTTTNGIIANGTANGGGSGKTGDSKHISDITNGPIQCKEAWPSLSTSPIDGSTHGNGGGGSNKENKINGGSNKENGTRKHEKSRSKGGRKHRNNGREGDRLGGNKDGKQNSSRQGKDNSTIPGAATGSRTSGSTTNVAAASAAATSTTAVTTSSMVNGKTSVAAIVAGVNAATNAASAAAIAGAEAALTNGDAGEKEVPSKKLINGLSGKSVHLNDLLDDDDDDELDFEDLDNDALSSDNDGKTDTPSLSSSGSSHAGGDSGSTLSETPSGKSSPSAFPEPMSAGAVNNVITTGSTTTAPTTSTSSSISPPLAEEVPVSDSAAIAAMTNVPCSSPAITNGISSSSSSILSSFASDSDKLLPQQPLPPQANSEHVISSSASSSLFGQDGSNMTTTTVTMSTSSKPQQPQQPQNGMAKINSVLDNATSRFSKLGFFDDNSSFFSHSTFDPYSFAAANKLDGASTNLDGIQSSGLTSSQLPDLLSGTNDTNEQHTKEILKNLGNLQQQHHQQQQQQQQPHHLLNNVHLQQQLNGLGLSNSNGAVDGLAGLGTGSTDDWEAAFSKYVMRSKMDVEHHEELMRMQELQKRNIINTGLSSTQFNGFNGDYSDYFHNTNELNSRLLSQQQQQAHQRLQQQQQQQHTDMSHIYAGNMSKFFDFHKNQQQQLQQQSQPPPPPPAAAAGPPQPFLHNGHSALGGADPMNNIANLLENSRLNSHFLEQHTNGLLGPQLQKQRMLNGQLNAHSILLNGASPQQQQQQQQQQYPPQQNPVVDDDLGFDPFFETQKALAELINDEINQQQIIPQNASPAVAVAANHNHKLLENVQRTRMPPPGFNHMNAFGFGVPRAQVSGSKILPFMNLANNPQPQQQHPPQANWGQQLQQQQQQQFMGFPQNENHLAQSQPQNGHNKAGFGNNFPDWTSFDPAIVSFRQFSFMNGPNQQQQQQQQQQQPGDLFLTAQQQNPLGQQNMQQPGQGFGHHGINLQQQQQQQQPGNPQAQVNFSASHWLNSEQSAYMSSLAAINGFGAAPGPVPAGNGFDKFSIPMPPGFQAAAAAAAAQKQKAECIN